MHIYYKSLLLFLVLYSTTGYSMQVTDKQLIGINKLRGAIVKNDLGEVKWLTKVQKVDVTQGLFSDTTPLCLAAEFGSPNMLQFLLEFNADVNKPNVNSDTPLLIAIHTGKEDNVRLLLEHKADIHYVNKNAYTPLLIAVSRDKIEVLRLLLCYGADINQNIGMTALSRAATLSNLKAVKFLVEHGAKIEQGLIKEIEELIRFTFVKREVRENYQKIVHYLDQNVNCICLLKR